MVFPDRSAALAERTSRTLTKMLKPPAGPVGRGDRTNTARLEDAPELAEDDRRIFDVLDDLVRGDVIEHRVRERQPLQRRLVEDGAAAIG